MTKRKTIKKKTKEVAVGDPVPAALKAMGIVVQPHAVEENGCYGYCIAVVDRGFVWIGDCYRYGEHTYCASAYNIKVWGVKKGLGQLATTGPVKETELDPVPLVIIPNRAIIALVPAKKAAWKTQLNVFA